MIHDTVMKTYAPLSALCLIAILGEPPSLQAEEAQVLRDLPPKILTDVVCELSPLQRALYDDFSASDAAAGVEGAVLAAGGGGGGGGGAV